MRGPSRIPSIRHFSFVEGARFGNAAPLIFAELLRFLLADPLANAARYAEAVH
ncbi:hypothetical protein GV790_20060, partial [Nocardia cyriacigeorgica]|nr:hypothetical protein [Nocardia cyriacigeorgica]